MPLTPLSIGHLSLLPIAVCLCLHPPAASTERPLHNTYRFNPQDLEAQDRLRGGTPTLSETTSLQFALTVPELDQSSSPVQTLLNPTVQSAARELMSSQESLPPHHSLSDPAQIHRAEDEPPLTTVLVPPLRGTLPPPPQRLWEGGEMTWRLPTPRPILASFTIDSIAQVPEDPAPEASAGRRPRLRIEPTTPDEVPLDLRQEELTPKKIYSPSITILTPSAYGKSWRQASVGFGVQHRTRFTDSADGAFGVGFGLGDARKYVGLDVGLALTDLDSLDRGIISFKLHRQLPNLFAVAVGVNDAIGWGDGDVNGPSLYGVITKTFVLKENTKDLFSRIYVSAGAGTGRYRTESNIINDRDTPGVFGSLAVRVIDPMNVIAEWSGQDLSLGVSLRPFRQVPIVITPAVTDITGAAGDGARFIVGIGYAISF